MYPERTFDYANLFAALQNTPYGAKTKGSSIHENTQYANLIKPDVEDPMKYIQFDALGRFIAIDNNPKGQFTINAFNLNEKISCRKAQECYCWGKRDA